MIKNSLRTAAFVLAVAALPSLASAKLPDNSAHVRGLQVNPAGAVSAAAFPKWTGAIGRNWAISSQACTAKMGRDCKIGRWQNFLKKIKGIAPSRQIRQVNAFVNATRYRDDRQVWGKGDYWAAPGEFFARGGDCEDYAIAKYLSLKSLGFDPNAMRILVLKDRVRGLHAVLLVEHGGETLVLDNLSHSIKTWNEVPNYSPLYSVNEAKFWLHPGLKKVG